MKRKVLLCSAKNAKRLIINSNLQQILKNINAKKRTNLHINLDILNVEKKTDTELYYFFYYLKIKNEFFF